MLRAIPNDLSSFGRYSPKGFTAGVLDRTRRCPLTWGGARRAFILRGLAVKALAGRPLDVETLGAKMRLYPYNNTCEKRILFTPQFFDPAERAFLASRIRDDMIFVDIGANIG
ncbi:MAG: methyltransferase FkbM family, partial [Hyphomicrobiales bacterium]|nr:methyltransferase FkbM family [Hyphomicrobiales bacterium]